MLVHTLSPNDCQLPKDKFKCNYFFRLKRLVLFSSDPEAYEWPEK